MSKQAKASSMELKKRRSEFMWGWGFIAPTMIGLIILNIIPIIYTIYQSFFRVGDFGRGNVFVALDNYIEIYGDPEIWQALLNTLIYTIIEVPVSIVIALIFAVLLNKKIKYRAVYRTIFFIPMVITSVAVAMVWQWLYNAEYGLINNSLNLSVNWLTDPNIAIISIAIMGVWSVLGYNVVLFLAALQEVPKDYYEAAEIDGANSIVQLLKITIPIIAPNIFFVSIIRVIAALQLFDLVYMVVTIENPALQNVQSLVYLFYKYSFIEKNAGYGATVVVLLLLVSAIVTAIQLFVQKKYFSDR